MGIVPLQDWDEVDTNVGRIVNANGADVLPRALPTARWRRKRVLEHSPILVVEV